VRINRKATGTFESGVNDLYFTRSPQGGVVFGSVWLGGLPDPLFLFYSFPPGGEGGGWAKKRGGGMGGGDNGGGGGGGQLCGLPRNKGGGWKKKGRLPQPAAGCFSVGNSLVPRTTRT
jgi:hypothetical protein